MEVVQKVLSFEMQGSKLMLGVDSNKDGEKLLELSLDVSEGFKEAMKKGVALEGVKMVSFKFEGTKLQLVLDTDKDGKELMSLSLDLMEALDEIKTAIV